MSNTLVFYIIGPSRTGKDTFLDFIDYYYPSVLYRYDSALRAKNAAKALGWDEVKDPKGRELLVDLYNASMNYNSQPVKDAVDIIKRDKPKCLTIMVRQYSTLVEFLSLIPGKTIRFSRPESNSPEIEHQLMAEYPEDFKFDHYINNEADLIALKEAALSFYANEIEPFIFNNYSITESDISIITEALLLSLDEPDYCFLKRKVRDALSLLSTLNN